MSVLEHGNREGLVTETVVKSCKRVSGIKLHELLVKILKAHILTELFKCISEGTSVDFKRKVFDAGDTVFDYKVAIEYLVAMNCNIKEIAKLIRFLVSRHQIVAIEVLHLKVDSVINGNYRL
ncbi:MAG: hypothetical protein II805_00780 [Candidatus Methanomethylophilus sp.]|nr:hypothetical protein [Methanomethylophilus sp.]